MAACFLVLTDFTADADQALHYADALAAPLGASLVLLHIRRQGLFDPEAFTGRIQRMTEEDVATTLAARAAQVTAPVTVEMAAEGISDAVRQAVIRYQPLLVILGKPATDDKPDELVTTTSLTLLRATSVPLLVVPISGTAAGRPTQVMLAADGQPFKLDTPVLDSVQYLFNTLNLTVTVAYVAEPENSDSCAAALASVHSSGLGAALPAIRTHGTRHRQRAAGILQAATETHTDLIAVVARRRSFLGQLFNRSISIQVVLHSPLPVLLLPAAE